MIFSVPKGLKVLKLFDELEQLINYYLPNFSKYEVQEDIVENILVKYFGKNYDYDYIINRIYFLKSQEELFNFLNSTFPIEIEYSYINYNLNINIVFLESITYTSTIEQDFYLLFSILYYFLTLDIIIENIILSFSTTVEEIYSINGETYDIWTA